jgi:GNAT superfamily N-acetyltransferase
MIGTIEAGRYTLLSGLPTPDFNIVVVDSADQAPYDAALADIAAVGAPALLAFAAEGTAHQGSLPEGWQVVGEMPIMARNLAPGEPQDPRVRRATPSDIPAVADAWAAAYGFEPAVARDAAELIVSSGEPSRSWLLEADGSVVSAVVSTHVDDIVGIWAMATPPQHARHGYGRALLGSVLADAASQGARIGLLGATEAGYPLYESTGWRTVEHWTLATAGVSAQFH